MADSGLLQGVGGGRQQGMAGSSGMASSKVRRAAGYGRQCGMVSNRVWQALRYGRYEVHGQQLSMHRQATHCL